MLSWTATGRSAALAQGRGALAGAGRRCRRRPSPSPRAASSTCGCIADQGRLPEALSRSCASGPTGCSQPLDHHLRLWCALADLRGACFLAAPRPRPRALFHQVRRADPRSPTSPSGSPPSDKHVVPCRTVPDEPSRPQLPPPRDPPPDPEPRGEVMSGSTIDTAVNLHVNLGVLCGPCSTAPEAQVPRVGHAALATLAVRCPAGPSADESGPRRSRSPSGTRRRGSTRWRPGSGESQFGRLRRLRCYQRPGGVGSRADVEAEYIGRARDRRRIDAALRRAPRHSARSDDACDERRGYRRFHPREGKVVLLGKDRSHNRIPPAHEPTRNEGEGRVTATPETRSLRARKPREEVVIRSRRRLRRRHAAHRRPASPTPAAVFGNDLGDAAELPGRDPRARRHASPASRRSRSTSRDHDILTPGDAAERARGDEPGGAQGEPARRSPPGRRSCVNTDALRRAQPHEGRATTANPLDGRLARRSVTWSQVPMTSAHARGDARSSA